MKKILILLAFCFFNLAHSKEITHDTGTLHLDAPPKRIIALEFSFVDALIHLNTQPIGIADDGDRSKMLPQILEKLEDYQSVGMRSQPNLETIAKLKPDLIIADTRRHRASQAELEKIAPTLMLSSSQAPFTSILQQAQIIAQALNKEEQMEEIINNLHIKIDKFKEKNSASPRAFLLVTGENRLMMHSNQSFSGDLLQQLGFTVPNPSEKNTRSNYEINLEQLLALEPEILFIAHANEQSLARKLKNEILWQYLPAVQNGQTFDVAQNLWSWSRGIYAAENIIDEIDSTLYKEN